MDERHAQLLCGLVEEYIRTTNPVSSGSLARALQLDISPATIRHTLLELDQAGYIFQPHTSAGRIPTDRGYRFYVNQLSVHDEADTAPSNQRYRRIRAAKDISALASTLSKLAAAVVVTGELPSHRTAQHGLSYITQEENNDDLLTVREISWLADNINEYIDALAGPSDETTVYIGEENPFHATANTALLARTIDQPGKARTVVTIIGPKNMSYKKNMTLLNTLSYLLSTY